MKLATMALASAFMLSSTFALAYTNHHRSGVRTYHRSYARMQPAGNYYGGNYYRGYNYGWNGGAGGANNYGGLVGGGDNGTFRR